MARKIWLCSLTSISFFIILSGQVAWASACCGGGVAAPALIAGDDKAFFALTAGQSEVVSDVNTQRVWRDRETAEFTRTLTIEGAHIFRDRYQAGISTSVMERSRSGHSASGLGDTTLNFGYEYLPDWDYNPIRPKGLGYIQVIVPSGNSIYESDDRFLLESRGRGYWAFGAGTLLSKSWGPWDSSIHFGVHRSLSRSYSNSQSSGELHPGWGGALALGFGYRFRNMRAGGGINWLYEDPTLVTGTVDSRGSAQRLADAHISLAYFVNEAWTFTVSAQDQTLFGRPVNTSLNRGLFLKLAHQLPR